MKKRLAILVLTLLGVRAVAQEDDITSVLMRSTFKIQGKQNQGTAFVLGKPLRADPKRGFYVLVSAAHVLDGIPEDVATLHLRRREGDTFVRLPFTIQIRCNGLPLWKKHPDVDVAAMAVPLPRDADIQLVSTNLLATDRTLTDLEVRPGDDLLVLGFPYGAESNAMGFPILRSGRVASYPLTPTKLTKSFLLDFAVFKGNSGGPVFMYHENRIYGGGTHIGRTVLLAGLVSEQQNVTEQVRSLTETLIKQHALSLGVVVHASFIEELLQQVEEPPDAR